MKIAHLILAHSEPLQLERLINSLAHEDAFFFIHIDKKTDIAPFQFLAEKKRVTLVEDRVQVSWGAYSIVQATLNGFQAIVQSGYPVSLVNLLSGSDYPLKNPVQIHQFFDEHPGENFMQYQVVHTEWHEAISRLTEYHLTNYAFLGKYVVQKWLNILMPARTVPDNLVPVGRSQWLSITIEAVKFILDYLNKKPRVVRFFKLTWAPDEIIFQTILYNSDFRSTMINNNLRYIDWSAGKASPKTLDSEDYPLLLASDALFARKFDAVDSTGILNQLDKQIRTATPETDQI
jgi:hypothetical protein